MRENDRTDVANKILSRVSMILCVGAILGCVITATIVFVQISQIARFYEDLDSDLPAMVTFVIRLKNTISAVLFTAAIILAVKEMLLSKRRDITIYINAFMLIFSSLLLSYFSFMVVNPLSMFGHTLD